MGCEWGHKAGVGWKVGMDIRWILGKVMVWEGLNVGGTGGQGRPPAEHWANEKLWAGESLCLPEMWQ